MTGGTLLDQSFDDVWAECEDLFAQARKTLVGLKETQPAHVVQASVNALFRTTHTLKGMAGMLGFPSFSRAAHRMEDIFDLMRQGRLRSTDSLVETLEAGMMALESGLNGLRRGRPEPEDYLSPLRKQLGELEALARPTEGGAQDLTSMLDLPPEALKALSEYERTRVTALLMSGMPIHGATICLEFATFDERLRVLNEALAGLGELISTLPCDAPEDREGMGFLLLAGCPALDPAMLPTLEGELVGTALLADPSRVPDSLRNPPTLAVEEVVPPIPVVEPESAAPQAPHAQEVEILRLPAHRVEALEARLMAVGQLRDAASQLLHKGMDIRDDRPSALMAQIQDGLLEVQKSLLQMRMLRVESLFARIEPMVKSLSRDTGKPVKLTFQGSDLELERGLLGRLTDPFLHLVRNAVDHGLETPSERLALGKSEAGSIRISASQRGRNIRFDIRDDGRGFDLARIEARGVALGLLKAGQAHTPERLHRLTLEPGFSTQERASQISGRGVGMDVVRAEIEALGGEIHLSSEARRGSLIRLSIPLSRAVASCLKVRCDRQSFGIPLVNVVRVQAGDQVHRGGDQVQVFGNSIPLESLQACLGLPEPDGQRSFVVLSTQGASARSVEVAIGVDAILGRGEVLLRSLPELAHAAGIMGGSPQEDGILWVLDPEATLSLAMNSLMRRVANV
ncbi:chemotaxis protein CheA [Geothrix sp. PMB-07]|uniref:chemotaxis protein CheA n=1 Tax=Geothrix sp. PMB-07 TaxID=3068640 RepID=UPI00274113FE|nr:ATP-binding protein [Geothrix sp. PMB-07]WLT33413.1 Hpt domain-containing protein [Geothrix sp. PMB-07]